MLTPPKGTATAPSSITARRSGSTRTMPTPSSAAAPRTASRTTTTAAGEEIICPLRLRVEPDRSAVVGDAAIVVALVGPGEAPVEQGRCVIRAEADRLVEIGDGAVVLVLAAPGEAAIITRA